LKGQQAASRLQEETYEERIKQSIEYSIEHNDTETTAACNRQNTSEMFIDGHDDMWAGKTNKKSGEWVDEKRKQQARTGEVGATYRYSKIWLNVNGHKLLRQKRYRVC